VRLLLDQHLSRRLVSPLQALYPGSAHVIDFGLDRADDGIIWDFAAANGFAICTKDADFQARSFAHGHPPKVILIVTGNGPSREVLMLLTGHAQLIAEFEEDPAVSLLVLPRPTLGP
jgi:predicted nuclease of predicted toxin-antitoxin system